MISFRESNLLYQPGVGSAANKQRVAAVLAHELGKCLGKLQNYNLSIRK